jgi:hypothetical protein
MFKGLDQDEWRVPKKEFSSIKNQLKDGVTFNLPRKSYMTMKDDNIVIIAKLTVGDDGEVYYFWVTNDVRRNILETIRKEPLEIK